MYKAIVEETKAKIFKLSKILILFFLFPEGWHIEIFSTKKSTEEVLESKMSFQKMKEEMMYPSQWKKHMLHSTHGTIFQELYNVC